MLLRVPARPLLLRAGVANSCVALQQAGGRAWQGWQCIIVYITPCCSHVHGCWALAGSAAARNSSCATRAVPALLLLCRALAPADDVP